MGAAADGGMQRVIGWLAAAVITTLIFGSVYVSLQQLGRRSADDAPAAAAAAQVQLIGSEPPGAPRLELGPTAESSSSSMGRTTGRPPGRLPSTGHFLFFPPACFGRQELPDPTL